MNPTIYTAEVGDQLTVLRRGLPFLPQLSHHGSPTRRWSGPLSYPIRCSLCMVDRRRGLRFTSARSPKAVAVNLVGPGDGERDVGAPESRLETGAALGPSNGPRVLLGVFLQDHSASRLLVGLKRDDSSD